MEPNQTADLEIQIHCQNSVGRSLHASRLRIPKLIPRSEDLLSIIVTNIRSDTTDPHHYQYVNIAWKILKNDHTIDNFTVFWCPDNKSSDACSVSLF